MHSAETLGLETQVDTQGVESQGVETQLETQVETQGVETQGLWTQVETQVETRAKLR